jgi:hypothetical protein
MPLAVFVKISKLEMNAIEIEEIIDQPIRLTAAALCSGARWA